jgi:hypothetical protein
MAGSGVVFNLDNVGSHDAYKPVKHRACSYAVGHALPFGPVAQADSVMVPVRVPEPKHQAPGRFRPQRINELLAQQAHRRRAQDDDSLLVQADNTEIRPKIKQFGGIEVLEIQSFQWRVLDVHVATPPPF